MPVQFYHLIFQLQVVCFPFSQKGTFQDIGVIWSAYNSFLPCTVQENTYPITPVQNRFILSSKAFNPLGFNLISTNRMPYINVTKGVKASMKTYTIDFTNFQLSAVENVVKSLVCCSSNVILSLHLVPLCICNAQKQFNLEKILHWLNYNLICLHAYSSQKCKICTK